MLDGTKASDKTITTLRRIALIGAIANPNFGDDAILDGWLRRIDAVFGRNAIVHVLTKDAGLTERTVARGHVCHVTVTDALHHLTVECGFSFSRMREAERLVMSHATGKPVIDTDDGTEPLDDRFVPSDDSTCISDALIDEVASLFDGGLDVLHVIGGGYVNSMWPDMLAEVHLAASLAREVGAKVILTGQCMSPMGHLEPPSVDADFRETLSDVLEMAELIDFRDDSHEGIGALSSSPTVMRTCDDLAIPPFDLGRRAMRGAEPYGNICLVGGLSVDNGDATAMRRRTANIVAGFVRQVLREDWVAHVNILEMSPNDSQFLVDALGGPSDKIRFLPLHEMSTTIAMSVVANAEWNIGERFHLAVLSLAARVPSMSWYGNGYYENKMESAYSAWGYGSDRRLPRGWDGSSLTTESHSSPTPMPLVPEDIISEELLMAFTSEPILDATRTWLFSRRHMTQAVMRDKLLAVASAYVTTGDDPQHVADVMTSLGHDGDEPDVSIIVPSYNVDRWVGRCLDSLLSQRECDIEVICVDDGSTDRTHVILYERAWDDPRVRLVPQRNEGVSAARNRALSMARGRYVMFCDPDDWYADDLVVSDLLTAAEEHGAKVVAGLFEEHPEGGEPIRRWSDSLCRYGLPRPGKVDYSEMQFDFGWVRCMYNRELLVNGGHWIPDRAYYEDPVWFASVMADAGWLWALDRPVYCYRTGHKDGDFFSSPADEQAFDLLRGIRDNIEVATEKGYGNLRSLTLNRLLRDYSTPVMGLLASNGELADEARRIVGKLGRDEYGDGGEIRIMAEMAKWVGICAQNKAIRETQMGMQDDGQDGTTSHAMGEGVDGILVEGGDDGEMHAERQ